MRATIGGDIPGAIAAVKAAMERHPLEHTIVKYCATRPLVCEVTPDWSYLAPADVTCWNPPSCSKLVAYFEHLEKYPRLVKGYRPHALLSGSKVGAVAELEDLISGYPNLGAINSADREGAAREMAAGPERWFVIQDPTREKLPIWRTQYRAYTSLMRWYAGQGGKRRRSPPA